MPQIHFQRKWRKPPRGGPGLLGLWAVCALVFSASAAGGVDETIPNAFPKIRYEALRVRSPFAVATVEKPPPPQAGFAENWFVSGIGRIGDDNFVTIKSRDLSTQFTVSSSDARPANGITVVSVNWSDTVGKSTVVLRKGGETAQLEFNEAQVRAAPQPAAAPPNPAPGPHPGQPGIPPIPPSAAAAAGATGAESPAVRRRNMVIVPPK